MDVIFYRIRGTWSFRSELVEEKVAYYPLFTLHTYTLVMINIYR